MKVVFGRKRIDFAALETDSDFQRLRGPVVMIGTDLPERGVAYAFRESFRIRSFAIANQPRGGVFAQK